MPIACHLVALTAAALIAGTTPSEALVAEPVVDCDQIILEVESGRYGGRRVALGVVSVPLAYLPEVVLTGSQAWPYASKAGHASKAGLVIRGGSAPVRVSVHPWRRRAATEWGRSGIVSSLRIASCPAYGRDVWNAYSGGFHVRSRTACARLIVRVGQRSRTVRFGLGRRCV